ncbi:MAG: transglutaminase-like domain-containing protein, partial [Pirellula sp.]
VKRRYSFMSLAFASGNDSPLLPDFSDCLEDKQPSTFSLYRGELTRIPSSMDEALPELERIMALSREPLQSKLSKAFYLEDYFANSGDFNYTLSLTGPKDRNLDPITDFIINKKRGHCQYFASSLALILRSFSIPTRLVIGFRPNEYNDVGGYFPVLQQHAHTWVEAYFTLDEIAKSEEVVRNNVIIPPWATKGVWIRLDPTPSGEGSNAGGTFRISRTQTLDAMQDLWTEMVMNMDKSKQGSIFSLFGESSGSSYSNVWLQIQSALYRMQSSRFIGGLLSPDRWFSWRVAVAIFGVGGLFVAIFRFVPQFFPNLVPTARRRKNSSRRDVSRVEFYERVSNLLRKLGLRREDSQTQREFLNFAAAELLSYGVSINAGDLSESFYEQRFGEARPLDAAQKDRIQVAVSQIESALKAGVRRKKHRS